MATNFKRNLYYALIIKTKYKSTVLMILKDSMGNCQMKGNCQLNKVWDILKGEFERSKMLW